MKILLFEMLFYLYAHHPRVYVESIDKIFIIILDFYSNVSCTSKCYGPRNIFSDHQNFTKSQNLFELYIYIIMSQDSSYYGPKQVEEFLNVVGIIFRIK